MAKYQIGVVVGSIRKDSFNSKLANALSKLIPSDFEFKFLNISELPLYNQDHDGNPSAAVTKFKSEIKASNGILFLTPEYNRGVPGVLKNALDCASRPYGDSAWAGIPAAVIGVSVGKIGTALAQHQLRNVLAYLDMPTMGQPEAYLMADADLFDDQGNIGPKSKDFLQQWIDSFAAWVKTHAK